MLPHKALSAYSLIEDNDKVLVALSGGKDSLCLLELLARRMRIQRPLFKVEAIHIRMENIHYETDTAYLQNFCSGFGVPLHIVTTRFDAYAGTKKPACFLCSRRVVAEGDIQHDKGQSLAATRCTANHLDDIVQTALMNVFSQGHFSTMPARLTMRKMPLTIIRPLCLETEADIQALAEIRQYEKQLKTCPYEKASSRADIKLMLAEAEKINPDAKYSILNALDAEGKLVE